jgi:hypothetical protein
MLMAVCPGSFLAPSGQQLRHSQDSSVLPDPPQADLASQPLVQGLAVRLVQRDRTARASQHLNYQRL